MFQVKLNQKVFIIHVKLETKNIYVKSFIFQHKLEIKIFMVQVKLESKKFYISDYTEKFNISTRNKQLF